MLTGKLPPTPAVDHANEATQRERAESVHWRFRPARP